jgi:hypothetical protein
MQRSSIELIVRYRDAIRKAYVVGEHLERASVRLDLLISVWQ